MLLATPITYTFLNLAGKIGPNDDLLAFFLGGILWLGGMMFGLEVLDFNPATTAESCEICEKKHDEENHDG